MRMDVRLESLQFGMPARSQYSFINTLTELKIRQQAFALNHNSKNHPHHYPRLPGYLLPSEPLKIFRRRFVIAAKN